MCRNDPDCEITLFHVCPTPDPVRVTKENGYLTIKLDEENAILMRQAMATIGVAPTSFVPYDWAANILNLIHEAE